MPTELNVLSVVNPTDQYVFLFDDAPESLQSLLHQFGILAFDEELSFTWQNAITLSQHATHPIKERIVSDH